jgi:hypothetical protein
MLYEMFTNEIPFDAAEPLDVAVLHMSEPPPPPRKFRADLSPAVEAVILKTLAKEPKGRYANGSALTKALDKALKTAPGPTPPARPHPTRTANLSMPQRVAVSLAKRPLPPLPAAVALPAGTDLDPAGPDFPKKARREDVKAEPAPTPFAAPRAAPRSLIYLGLGIGLALLTGLTLIGALVWLFWLRGGSDNLAAQFPPVENDSPAPTPVEAVSTAAPIPTAEVAGLAATPARPSALPTPTTLPEPQLVADTFQDFFGESGRWTYVWSRPTENEFEPMEFEERVYGLCWYAQDYIRICQESGHPGNGADIAWRWSSQAEGRVQVVLSARKIDQGGDGVTILAYHNDELIQGQQIEPRDTRGVVQKNWFEVEIKAGDSLLFVMNRNGNAQSDHTFFQVQISNNEFKPVRSARPDRFFDKG